MKLVAVWIEEYAHFINQTFNLGSGYQFSCEFNEQNRTLLVSAIECDEYINLFESPIISVTGLIGNNGSGKSNFMKFLNVIESDKHLKKPVVFIFQIDSNKGPQFLVRKYKKDPYLFDIKNDINVSFSSIGINLLNLFETDNIKLELNKPPLDKINLVYYSNDFNGQNDKFLKKENDLNRSLSFQVIKSLEPYRLNKLTAAYKNSVDLNETIIPNIQESFNPLKLYFNDRLHRQISFLSILNTKHKSLTLILNKIKFPASISIWFNKNIFEKAESLAFSSIYDFKCLVDLNKFCLNEVNATLDLNEKLKKLIIISTFNYTFSNDFFRQSNPNVPLQELSKFLNNLEISESTFDELKNYLLQQKSISDFTKISLINNLLKNLNEIVSKQYLTQNVIFLSSEIQFDVRISDDIWPLLESLLSVGFSFEDGLISYGWSSNLSSGEEALLTQYSELYEGLKNSYEENLIISIDEGELFLHADWQKDYLKSLITFLKYFIDKENKETKVQLILSSHSPFIVSDLPKSNLIFLRKNYETGLSQVIPSINKHATFGSNIYDLLADSFFMSEGFIGSFAQEKIDEVYSELSNKIENTKYKLKIDKSYIKSIISIVGEPLIQRQLSLLYDRVFNEDLEVEIIDRQMEALKKLKERKLKGKQ